MLSRRQIAQENYLMDRESVEYLSRKEKEGSIERESIEDLSSLKKRSFSREEKHIKVEFCIL